VEFVTKRFPLDVNIPPPPSLARLPTIAELDMYKVAVFSIPPPVDPRLLRIKESMIKPVPPPIVIPDSRLSATVDSAIERVDISPREPPEIPTPSLAVIVQSFMLMKDPLIPPPLLRLTAVLDKLKV
jgi:hypothetical protein